MVRKQFQQAKTGERFFYHPFTYFPIESPLFLLSISRIVFVDEIHGDRFKIDVLCSFISPDIVGFFKGFDFYLLVASHKVFDEIPERNLILTLFGYFW